MTRRWRWVVPAIVFVTVAVLAGRDALAQPPLPLRLTAFAVNMSNVGRGGAAGTIDFTVDRWSTAAERDKLLSTFLERGPEKLLEALQDAKPVGRILAPAKVGWDLRYATLSGASGRRLAAHPPDRSAGRFPGSAQPAAHDGLPVHAHRNQAQSGWYG